MKLIALILTIVLLFATPAFACRDGKDGVDGKDGIDGVNGEDGQDGANGVDGINGTDGQDGRDYYNHNECGVGADVILYENTGWFRELNVEYRVDFNNGEPVHKAYVVGRIKLWK